MILGEKRGKIWPPGQIDPKWIHPAPKHVIWMHWAKIHASKGNKLWTHWRNQKINKKTREGTTSPICPPHPHFRSAATIFCMWGRTVDVIRHARFQVNRFRGFGASGGRKWPSPIDLVHRPYNSVRTNVLHCDYIICFNGICVLCQWYQHVSVLPAQINYSVCFQFPILPGELRHFSAVLRTKINLETNCT